MSRVVGDFNACVPNYAFEPTPDCSAPSALGLVTARLNAGVRLHSHEDRTAFRGITTPKRGSAHTNSDPPMKVLRAAFFVLTLSVADIRAEPPAPSAAPSMSPELQQLIQSEMRELLAGVQTVAASIPTGNWEGIATAAVAMRTSYVLEKKLTKDQRAELDRLPDDFKALDQAFHIRAEKLAHSAKAQDAEAVSFQFSRLLETCVACHSAYARTQFPTLGSKPDDLHRH